MAAELVGDDLHGLTLTPTDFDFSMWLGPQLQQTHERVMEAGNDAGEGPGESSTHFLSPSPAEGNDVPEPDFLSWYSFRIRKPFYLLFSALFPDLLLKIMSMMMRFRRSLLLKAAILHIRLK